MPETSNEDRYEQLKREIITTYKAKLVECVNCNCDQSTHFIQGAARALAGLIEFMKILDGETEPAEGA